MLPKILKKHEELFEILKQPTGHCKKKCGFGGYSCHKNVDGRKEVIELYLVSQYEVF